MARTVNITSTATPGSGQTITSTTYRLLAADGTTVLSTSAPPYVGVSDGLLYVEQTVTQSDAQTDVQTNAIAGRVTDLSAGSPTASTIDLSWTDVGGETAYDVHRSTTALFTPGTGNRIATDLAAGSTGYQATGLDASTPYYFQVIAKNASGATTGSNEATATTSSGATVYGQDDFTAADDTVISARATTWQGGAGTGSWVKLDGSDGRILNNRFSGAYGSNTNYGFNITLGSADYAIEFSPWFMGGTGKYFSIVFRYNSTSGDWYQLLFTSSNKNWTLRKFLSNAFDSTLGTYSAGYADGTGEVLTMRVAGTSLKLLRGATELISATDSSISGAGAVSMDCDSSSVEGIHLDYIRVLGV